MSRAARKRELRNSVSNACVFLADRMADDRRLLAMRGGVAEPGWVRPSRPSDLCDDAGQVFGEAGRLRRYGLWLVKSRAMSISAVTRLWQPQGQRGGFARMQWRPSGERQSSGRRPPRCRTRSHLWSGKPDAWGVTDGRGQSSSRLWSAALGSSACAKGQSPKTEAMIKGFSCARDTPFEARRGSHEPPVARLRA